MTKGKWEYIGDGVYFMFDGYGVWLHANSHDNPTDKIYLEPSVLNALVQMYKLNTQGGENESGEGA